MLGHFISQMLLLFFPFYVLVGAIFDMKTLRIPNSYNLFGFLMFFPVFYFSNIALNDMGIHLLTFVVVLIIGFAAFAAGFFGGGDAKFIAVIALWIGYEAMLNFLFFMALFGGILAVIVTLGGRYIPDRYQPEIFKNMVERKVVPYGTAMSLAAIVIYDETRLWALFMS